MLARLRTAATRALAGVLMAPTLIRPWYRWGRWIGVLALAGIRIRLRQGNLHNTRRDAPPVRRGRRASDARDMVRDPLGRRNDLNDPVMGSAGERFGRNFPLAETRPDPIPAILEPNPRVVSRELMTRHEFLAVPGLNVLAAAWIQFMVHGWFSHGDNEVTNPWEIAIADDDPWSGTRPMRIRRTHVDPDYVSNLDPAPTYVTRDTHWWDASQLYGSNPARRDLLRSRVDGKLRLVSGLLPVEGREPTPDERAAGHAFDDDVGNDLTGFNDNYWVGLSAMHTLFAHEHNAICDRLKAAHPDWDDDALFEHARLVNAALIAKIHTIEWTPALLDNPSVRLGMNANWGGILPRWLKRRIPFSLGQEITGILGSARDHSGVPYSLTEEFVSVYRMHPLLPDTFEFRSHATGALIESRALRDAQGASTRPLVEKVGIADLLYSLGVGHPGQITLHNYPRDLQQLPHREEGEDVQLDVAALDIMRDRERGVPRYNRFRHLLRLPPIRTFAELTNNAQWAAEIERVYGGDIERVDLLVGMLAEPLLPGFAFSETAFRIFVLMASRRLASDRFFTDDFRREIYTQEGLDWIDRTTFSSVVLRHYPSLGSALRGLRHGFAPWNEALP
jgi:Animal haem peroxidase